MKAKVNGITKQSGISLIEVLVSAVLISMVFLWISDTHMASLTDIADTNNRSKVVWITEGMIERIKVNPLLDRYKSEINSAKNISSYCRSPVRCINKECSEDQVIKYDVQQVFCNNLEGLDGLEMVFECFDIATGERLNPCYKRGTLRGRFTVTWNSKDPSRGQLSSYSEVLFVINQSLYFDGSNDYLKATGSLFSEDFDFTVSMWVRPASMSSQRGLFGHEDTSNDPSRSPSLSLSNGALTYESYTELRWVVLTKRECLEVPSEYIGEDGNPLVNLETLKVIHDHVEHVENSGTDVDTISYCADIPYTVQKALPYGGDVYEFFSKDQWNHVTWIRRGDKYVIYRNGVLIDEKIELPDDIYLKDITFIGRVGSGHFVGEIDDVQVYKGVLSENQILSVMEGHIFPDMGLSLYLDFDGDDFNNMVKDKSEENRSLSVYGGMNDNSRRHVVR